MAAGFKRFGVVSNSTPRSVDAATTQRGATAQRSLVFPVTDGPRSANWRPANVPMDMESGDNYR